MDWDDEELSTQIYDRPDEAGPSVVPRSHGAPAVGGHASAGAGPLVTGAMAELGMKLPPHVMPPLPPSSVPPPPSSPPGAGEWNMGALGEGEAPRLPPPEAGPPAPSPSNLPISSPQLPPLGPVQPPSGVSAEGVPSPFSMVSEALDPPLPSGPAPSPAPARAKPKPKRRERGYSPLLLGLLAFTPVAILLGLGLFFVLAPSEHAEVIITTTPPDAEITFDEQPVEGEVSPFVIDVDPSLDKHLLVVRRAGYATYVQELPAIGAGERLRLDEIVLEETDMPVTGTGFVLSTEPAGARVYVDGTEIDQRTPVQVVDLQAGTYAVRVEHGSRFEPWDTEIDVSDNEVVQLPRVSLRLRSVTVQFRSDPPGAAVTLVRGRERRAIGSTPTNADVDLTGDDWRVEMSLDGFHEWGEPLDPPSGEDEFEVRAELRGVERPSPARPSTPRAAPAPRERAPFAQVAQSAPAPAAPLSMRPGIATGPRPTPAPTPRMAEPAAPAPGGTGTLQIQTVPWSQVTVNGRMVGNTPQQAISLPPGNHQVTLVNPEFNIRHTIMVQIRAGETTRRIERLPIGGG